MAAMESSLKPCPVCSAIPDRSIFASGDYPIALCPRCSHRYVASALPAGALDGAYEQEYYQVDAQDEKGYGYRDYLHNQEKRLAGFRQTDRRKPARHADLVIEGKQRLKLVFRSALGEGLHQCAIGGMLAMQGVFPNRLDRTEFGRNGMGDGETGIFEGDGAEPEDRFDDGFEIRRHLSGTGHAHGARRVFGHAPRALARG